MAEEGKKLDGGAGGVHHVKAAKKSTISAYDSDAFREEQRVLREEVEARKKREKAEAKAEAAPKGEKTPAAARLKRWWYGMGKESRRVSWPTPRYLMTSLLIVIAVIAVMTAVFYGINELFVSLGVVTSGT